MGDEYEWDIRMEENFLSASNAQQTV